MEEDNNDNVSHSLLSKEKHSKRKSKINENLTIINYIHSPNLNIMIEHDIFHDSIDDIITLLNRQSVLEPKQHNQQANQYISV